MEKIPLVKADIVLLDNSCEHLVTASKTLDLGDNQTTYIHRKLKKTNSNKIGHSISNDLQKWENKQEHVWREKKFIECSNKDCNNPVEKNIIKKVSKRIKNLYCKKCFPQIQRIKKEKKYKKKKRRKIKLKEDNEQLRKKLEKLKN